MRVARSKLNKAFSYQLPDGALPDDASQQRKFGSRNAQIGSGQVHIAGVIILD